MRATSGERGRRKPPPAHAASCVKIDAVVHVLDLHLAGMATSCFPTSDPLCCRPRLTLPPFLFLWVWQLSSDTYVLRKRCASRVKDQHPPQKLGQAAFSGKECQQAPLRFFPLLPRAFRLFFFWARRVGVSPAFLVGSAVVFGATRLVGEKRTLIFRETCIGPRGPRSGALHPWKKEERRCSFRHRLLDFLCQLPGTLARVTKGTNRCLWVGGL